MKLREQAAEFERRGATVLVIDAQETFRARDWKEKLKLPWPILADATGQIGARYGIARQLVVHDEWVNAPAVFILDREGKVRWSKLGLAFNDRPKPEEILAALEQVRSAAGK